MGSKSASNCQCCCSDCSPVLPQLARGCCLCTCDELCVTVTAGNSEVPATSCQSACLEQTGTIGYCLCVETNQSLSWDENLCAWNGTVGCGTLAIDLKIEIQQGLNTGTGSSDQCYLKVNSVCLGLTDELYPLPGCDGYHRRCGDRGAGTLLSLDISNIDASGCGDSDCTDVSISIGCAPYVNPDLVDMKCKNCDCVCQCICITYEEDGCSVTKRACWNGNGWSVTFDDDCPWSAQTVGISFEEGPNRCCVLEASVSRGTLDVAQMTAACPRISNTWTGTFASGTGTNGFTISAACESSCGGCTVDSDCCDNVPLTIYLVVCEDNCNQTGCIALDLVSYTADEVSWRGSGSADCSDGADPDPSSTCEPFVFDVELVCVANELGGDDWYVRFYCNDIVIQENLVTGATCEPLCATTTVPVEVFSTDDCNVGIGCIGTTVRFDFVQECRPIATAARSAFEHVTFTDAISYGLVIVKYNALETVTFVDTSALSASASSGLTESFTISDSVSFDLTFPLAATESLALGDSVGFTAAGVPAISEDVLFSDTVGMTVVASNSIAESLTFSDTVSFGNDTSIGISDSLTLGDSVGFTSTASDEIAESLTLSDSVSGFAVASSDTTDIFTLGDSVTFEGVFPRGVSESFSLNDVVSFGFSIGTNAIESFSLGDSVTLIAGQIIGVSESTTFSDVVGITVVSSSELAETLTLDDVAGLTAAGEGSSPQSMAFSDAVSFTVLFPISITESLTLSDVVSGTASATGSVAESLTLADTVTSTSSAIGSIAESLSLADTVSFGFAINIGVLESVNFSDSITMSSIASDEIAEDATVSDIVSSTATASDEVDEDVVFNDTVDFTTTPATCVATCLMEWDDGLNAWLALTDNCEEGCRCPTALEALAELGPGSMQGEQQNATCVLE